MSDQINLSDLIELCKKVVKFVFKQYRIFIFSILLSLLIALSFWFLQPHKYTATATFIVEEGSNKGGGLSGIASQFGIDIGSMMGGGSSGIFAGENIYEIMKSRLILEKVLLSKVDSNLGSNSETIADLYLRISGLNKKLFRNGYSSKQIKFNYVDENTTHTVLQDSILYLLTEEITNKNLFIDKQNKKTSIINLTVTSSDQIFSKLFIEKLLNKTSELYIDIKTRNLSKNINKIQNKADSLQLSLNKIYDRTYINLSRPQEATARDKTVTYTLYGEVIKNLETLKISLINQTPLIQILDLPKYPLIDEKLSLLILVFIGLISGFFIHILVSIFLFFEKNNSSI